ncbi:MAG: NAD(P)-dependent oxidoreductase [Nitrospirae bacterium]|nr:NAD(P)-dependent oxidoreductase [Nitrospirota bacterium]
MKILVTGASGFIGRNLLLSLKAEHNVVALYNKSADFPEFLSKNSLKHIVPLQIDLSLQDDIDKVAGISSTFDSCVYLAANGDPAVSAERPAFDLISNSLTLVNLLEKVSFGKFIYFSSGAVYDGIKGAVSPEVAVSPRLPYAISNLASENYIRFFQRIGRIRDAIIVRFFGAYGPYEPSRKIYSRLVRQFGIEQNPRFTIRGNGLNLIDAMYVDDTVHAIHLLLNSQSVDKTLDLYSGRPLSLTELVKSAARVFDLEAEISYEGCVPEYIEFYSADKFMDNNFGFLSSITLKEGLLKLFDYLNKNYMQKHIDLGGKCQIP